MLTTKSRLKISVFGMYFLLSSGCQTSTVITTLPENVCAISHIRIRKISARYRYQTVAVVVGQNQSFIAALSANKNPMKSALAVRATAPTSASTKVPTGIAGFDEITVGGLPRGRTTLITGGPGSGKTIFALQFLVHGASACRESGIFVAFEENSKRIVANTEGFDWNLSKLSSKKLAFIDAQPSPDLIQSGRCELRLDQLKPHRPCTSFFSIASVISRVPG